MRDAFDCSEAIKALAHPGRFEFMVWLKQPELYFGLPSAEAIGGVSASCFQRGQYSQPAISAHLTVLHRAGLITSKKAGARVLFRRHEQNIALLKAWLSREI